MTKKRSKAQTQEHEDAARPDETIEETPEPRDPDTQEAASEAAPAGGTGPEEPREDYLVQLQRLQAEFSNYRKRTARERLAWEDRAKGEILQGLLPVLDDIDRARDSIGSKKPAKEVEGMMLILGRLEDQLRIIGLERQPIEPGTPFDPDRHEAMMTEPSEEFPEGAILGTLQPGYLFRGILLRPGRVRVSSGPPVEGPEAREEESKTRDA
ncbi:MAG: nucleotide exchange factor GrpE [Candidatus Eisenbacteria bacterium]|nr:nucleotide exchange factor GrpE [Candidatus Latescibacterota bacterium]MBD3301013.1 nucleotide exchange factor GrpE [Candidatus Eisenbacteria bacterium]